MSSITSAGGVGEQPHLLVPECRFHQRAGGDRRPPQQLGDLLACRKLGHAGLGQELLDEVAVLLGNHGAELLLQRLRAGLLALALVLAGKHDVHAVGLVPYAFVDPEQLPLELLRGEADCPQDAEPADVADRGDHVAAM
jgi:hypothetical protein